jgi:radical SAM superfamily enzyme YgiQ (UPF0313 family)
MLEQKLVERKDFRVLITYPNYSMMLTPSYAVGLFTAILKKQGYNVDLFDCTQYMASYEASGIPNSLTLPKKLSAGRIFDPVKLLGAPKTDLLGDFGRRIDYFKPHAVVFSTVVQDTWPQTRDLLKILSEHSPQTRSIVGGVYTTMAPAKVIEDPYVQCIGQGEGENTIVDFCEAVRNGISPIRILGTSAKDENGKVINNLPRPLVDMNKTPIADFSLFDKIRFNRPLGAKDWRAIPIETFRGCPYTCTFCNSPQQAKIAEKMGLGNFRRRKSMDTLRNEITTLLEKNDGNFLYINDDAFMARPKEEIEAFAKMYADIRVPFWFQTRFEDITEKHLAMLKEVGTYRISFGLEHGNEKFRKEKLLRNISNEKMIEKSEIVAKVGIPYSVNVIIGMPEETRDLVFDTIRLNRQLGGFDFAAPNIFTPYDGTPLRDKALEKGWLDPTLQTNSFVGYSLLRMPPPYLQPEEMLGLQRTYNFYVAFPEDRWPEIRRAETFDTEGNEVFELLREEFFKKKYGTTEAERMLTYAG